VSVEDKSLKGAGFVLKQKIWDAARSTIEQWTGQKLAECSLYGIRIYEEGAILATHVDRLPLVSSGMLVVGLAWGVHVKLGSNIARIGVIQTTVSDHQCRSRRG
jgi:hypothetical protein